MQIPVELIVFGRAYEVRNTSPVHDLEGILGSASYRNGTIYLDPSLDMALALNTVWNEVANIAQQEILGAADGAQAPLDRPVRAQLSPEQSRNPRLLQVRPGVV